MLLRELADAGSPLLGDLGTGAELVGHPNRKAVNAALFRAFLLRLQTASTASAPAGYLREELVRQLRLASVDVAVERVNEEWARVAHREERPAPVLSRAADGTFYVVLGSGEVTTLAPVEYEDLRKHHDRLVRGVPELAGAIA